MGGPDAFIQKLDGNGNLIWVKQIGDSNAKSIATDGDGNVYTTGSFQGTSDFDPGLAIDNLTPNGEIDGFIQKLDGNGNLIWVKQFGGVSEDLGQSITLDANDNIYTTGYFSETVDFASDVPGAKGKAEGQTDVFVQKLDKDGQLKWVTKISGITYSWVNSITTDMRRGMYTP